MNDPIDQGEATAGARVAEDAVRVGVVAIGRNEGERLRRCLTAIDGHPWAMPVVYVDSGSTDDSVAFARELGVDVVELDLSKPFTMSRGRNAGWRRLLETHPGLTYVQFLDGDCEPIPSWFDTAVAALDAGERVGAVSGRRRERYRERTVYNRLADMEWDTPVGEARAVPGDMMVRVEALTAVDGFREDVIAAEDDELCIRIRGAGWTIQRLDAEMSIHDAAMTEFKQWWKRMVRCGHGFAQVHALHGRPPVGYFKAELRRTIVWGGVMPALTLLASVGLAVWSVKAGALPLLFVLPPLGLAGLHGVQYLKTYRGRRRRGDRPRDAKQYALFATISKLPSFLGVLTYWKRRALGQASTIIEYKGPEAGGRGATHAPGAAGTNEPDETRAERATQTTTQTGSA